MPKVGKTRKCIQCENPPGRYYYNGRFKGYRKTCDKHHGFLFRKGANNPAWKGGKIITKDGYVMVLDSKRRAKRGANRYILEHRLVMSSQIGRELKSNEIVHHVNGVRTDNRPENLALLCGPYGHETWTYPRILQERIRFLENKLYAQN